MGVEYFIDSHAHLYDKVFLHDIEQTVKRAHNKGVTEIIVPGDSFQTSVDAFIFAVTRDGIYSAAGVHPHEAKNLTAESFDMFKDLVTEPKVVAIGEIGLDYHYNYSPCDIQIDCFSKFLDVAIQVNKPVIIHCREAYQHLLPIIKERKYKGLRGVFHCFSGSLNDAEEILNLGFYISFAGSITFPKADKLREIVLKIPLSKMLLETDSPYLAPQPVRGKRNEPSYIIYNAEKIAFLHRRNLKEIMTETSKNSIQLFQLEPKPDKSALTYSIGNNLYINVTSNCTNNCIFCQRKRKPSISGTNLWLAKDPSAEDIINNIVNPQKYDEVVFCGFGEPLLRLDVIKKVALWLKKNNVKRIRIDTNGQANLIYNRNICPELKGLIDAFSISLNASNQEQYQKICKSYFGAKSYQSIRDFIRECKNNLFDVTVSAVVIECISIDDIRKIVENELKCKFRLRQYRKEI